MPSMGALPSASREADERALVVPPFLPSQRWQLSRRPKGPLREDDFTLSQEDVTTDMQDGECIIEVELLSIDASLRTMLDENVRHGPVLLGTTLPSLGYGTVIASANRKVHVGTRVTGMLGARSIAKLSKAEASQLQRIPALPGVHPSIFMGLLGLTSGLTAWVGIHSVTKPPRRGETVVVSGAAGATGSVAAQLCKLRGAKVVGITEGQRKKVYLEYSLKLDGAIDYKDSTRSVGEQLDVLCPDGIDFFFDTEGGEILDDVLLRIREGGRVVICGASSQYNTTTKGREARGSINYVRLVERGALMVGYNVMSYLHEIPFAVVHLLWLKFRKKIFLTEHVELSMTSFAKAMVKMFTGGHIGKLLIDVSGDHPKSRRRRTNRGTLSDSSRAESVRESIASSPRTESIAGSIVPSSPTESIRGYISSNLRTENMRGSIRRGSLSEIRGSITSSPRSESVRGSNAGSPRGSTASSPRWERIGRSNADGQRKGNIAASITEEDLNS
ncbi:MAG: hypothetical protein SGPRY_008353 [Prymnesium sp.]